MCVFPRLVQGSKSSDAYRFYHWQYVDTFVYFSHHFITIPPPCWINAAHKHGVPVLGKQLKTYIDRVPHPSVKSQLSLFSLKVSFHILSVNF